MLPQLTGMEFHAAHVAVEAEQAGRVIFLTGGAFTPAAMEFLASRARIRRAAGRSMRVVFR